jgi:transposase
MANRQFKLSEPEIGVLRRAADSTKDADERIRLQAVRLYGEGCPVNDIMDITGCGERSLRRWVRKYQDGGEENLKSKRYGNQNSAKLTPEQRAAIKEKLNHYQPRQVLPSDLRVSQGEFWTVSDMRIAVKAWYGVAYQSENSYRTLLKECGFSLQRVEGQYRSRSEEEAIAEFEAELEKKSPTACKSTPTRCF